MKDEEFTEFMRKALEEIKISTISSALKITIPTVSRWANGVTAPHPMMREKIYETINKLKNSLKSRKS